MNVAIVGCGYVADLYLATLPNHPTLRPTGAWDRNPERLNRFTKHYRVPAYDSLEALLEDPAVDIVLNLTNPSSHYEVSRAALEAGKHVYSEKPLALDVGDARALLDFAKARGLHVASAPCNVLGEHAQTAWRALREGRIGRPLVAYAELDEGLVHLKGHEGWRSASGAPWPAWDEFKVGCTVEHAGYLLTWLFTFFGPARRVTAYSSNLIPDKGRGLDGSGADFSVACIEHASGVVSRLTSSIVAPGDHSLRIVGDEAMLRVHDAWDYGSFITLHKEGRFSLPRLVPLVRPAKFKRARRVNHRMDFSRGVADLADAIRTGRTARLSPELALHVTEVTLAIHGALGGISRDIESTFEPMEPMPWAVGPNENKRAVDIELEREQRPYGAAALLRALRAPG